MPRDAQHEARSTPALGRAIFVATTFLAAFLIFLVQPMVGKRLLPWFGGTPGVWTVCLAFYQTALFAGYAYAHFLIRVVSPRLQLGLHSILVAGAVFAPSVLPERAPTADAVSSPEADILMLLVRHVLLPFMVLAATGPLVQAWFARRYPERSPYPLYAVSNFGSMLALFIYPFFLEPQIGLVDTAEYWEAGFVIAVLFVLLTAILALLPESGGAQSVTAPEIPGTSRLGSELGKKTGPNPGEEAGRPSVTPSVIGLWFALSAGAVVMLNGLTNRLCLDIASVPFLWILPLATYLATFVIAFSSDAAYRRKPLFALVIALLATSAYQLLGSDRINTDPHSGLAVAFESLPAVIAYYILLLFGVCSILHGELHRLRPATQSLTLFYLCVSAGGATGGLFVGLAAPRLFSGYTEFGIGLALFLGLGAYAAARERGGVRRTWGGLNWRLRVVGVLGLSLIGYEVFISIRVHPSQTHEGRNFFGVLRVLESGEGEDSVRFMMHGTTLHGTQYTEGVWSTTPTSYFGRASSLATVMRMRPKGRPARVAVIGLGAGTIAAYARPKDSFRFYEIDPAVVYLARDSGDFTYLEKSQGEIEIRTGDGRLGLEIEQARGERQDFDILIVDAFSGDAVPVHLLTREAFEIYEDALAPDGIIALHLSNRHFDLTPIVARVGAELGLDHLMIASRRVPAWRTNPSKWVFLSNRRERLETMRLASRVQLEQLRIPSAAHRFVRIASSPLDRVPLWSDDFTNLFRSLRRDSEGEAP
jgi:spermidine synthase